MAICKEVVQPNDIVFIPNGKNLVKKISVYNKFVDKVHPVQERKTVEDILCIQDKLTALIKTQRETNKEIIRMYERIQIKSMELLQIHAAEPKTGAEKGR
ncbi:unnamed protein product [Allacma fusca]|uniref:Uncharacterized protein n=1 Tax=Allacma fusca TaxID=39272 RepID=A0A8J2P727_9HEXA|nr:unnamed protein product [Allacma fusca]